MEQVVLAISRRVTDEQVLETERKRALLRRCGVSEEELSRVCMCCVCAVFALEVIYAALVMTCYGGHDYVSLPLTQHGQLYLHVLSEAAELLAIKDTRNSSFLLALGELEDALDAAKLQSTRLESEHSASQRRAQALMSQWEQLTRVRDELVAATVEREERGAFSMFGNE